MPTNKTILILDDEADLRRSLAFILQSDGYSVTTGATAKEGLQLLQAGAFDLLFLDIRLPDKSGIEILPEIRKQFPDMPVLILTAHGSLDSAITAVRLGARDYLLKPADPEAILLRAKEILAEQMVPKKRREITTQIQGLLSELYQMDNRELTPGAILGSIPPTDPARYVSYGALVLDLHTRHVSFENRLIPLSVSTFDYLVTLVRHAPDPVSYQTLVKESQGYDLTRIEACGITRWQIHELRKVLEVIPHKPARIITVRDVGYRLVL